MLNSSRSQQLLLLAMLNREIQDPMNNILGFARLLAAVCRVDQERDCARMIISNAETILRVVENTLEFACIDAFRIKAQPFDICVLVEDVYRLLAPQAREKGICLEREVAVSGKIVGDVRQLRKVLVNLVSYAIQFTDEGYVKLRVSSDSSRISFSVEDSGIGISPEKLETIFDPFIRCEKNGGTGLGLAIARRLVELMGGALRVESKVNVGSRFYFELFRQDSQDFQDKQEEI